MAEEVTSFDTPPARACLLASHFSALGGEGDVAKKVHQVISVLEAHDWRKVRQRGSHRQFRRPNNSYVVTITGKRSDTMTVGQLRDIRRKSGLEELR